jgi:hypothetical protein
MNKLVKRGLLALTAVTVPLGTAATVLPMSAHASSSLVSKVKASTSTSDHVDTTSNAGTGTIDTPGGPQWAYDRLNFTLTAVRQGTSQNWSVTIAAKGLYEAIADPNTGNVYEGYGNVNGTLEYEVSSPNVPSAAGLPAVEAPSVSQSAIVSQLFGGNASITGGGHYDYTYTGLPEGTYTQVG